MITSIMAQVAAGDRILAMQVDSAQGQTYLEAIQDIEGTCVTNLHFAFVWSDLEPTLDNYNFSMLRQRLNQVSQAGNFTIEMNIPPVNMDAEITTMPP